MSDSKPTHDYTTGVHDACQQMRELLDDPFLLREIGLLEAKSWHQHLTQEENACPDSLIGHTWPDGNHTMNENFHHLTRTERAQLLALVQRCGAPEVLRVLAQIVATHHEDPISGSDARTALNKIARELPPALGVDATQ